MLRRRLTAWATPRAEASEARHAISRPYPPAGVPTRGALPTRSNYFDELLARIREIRASEKRFYQKVRDLFALSSDYKVREQDTNRKTQKEQALNLLAAGT